MWPSEPRWLLAIIFLMQTFSAHGEAVSARASARDSKVPSALVEQIEEEFKAFLLKENRVYRKEAFKRKLINLNAEFVPIKGSALRDEVKVVTPIGGGVVDLEDIITPLRGAFKLNIKPVKEDGQPFTATRVFYVSGAKKRNLAGESYGAGCGKFMDLTSKFNKEWGPEGMVLYSADQRYLSVIGGTFLFCEYSKESLFVGSVTFTDSRYPELLCE